MFMRDALNAGRSPPAKPMKIENAMDLIIIPGVIEKLNASSENV
jgi:hypothetical protein